MMSHAPKDRCESCYVGEDDHGNKWLSRCLLTAGHFGAHIGKRGEEAVVIFRWDG